MDASTTAPPTAPPQATILTAGAIATMPPEPLGAKPGVTRRVLWQSASSEAGVMTIAAGQRLGPHRHRVNHHHIWVIDGAAEVLGETVRAGAYVHIPSGIEHDLDASRTEGCTVFYVYEPPVS